VPSEKIIKGYDMGGGSYVIITDDDLAPLHPAKSKEINLETFVPEEDVNPLMFDSSYIIVPDKTAKPYALLANAMAGSGRVGVGRFVMRQKEYLAAVRSDGTHLTLSTLVFPDEMVEVESVEGMDALDDVEISNKELLMAKSLVEALSEEFEPGQYQDEYRLGIEKIIEQKAAGKTPVFAEEPQEKAKVIDLASALEASLRSAKEARSSHPSATSIESAPTKRGAATKAAPKKAAAKKPAATTTAKAAAPKKAAARKSA
jgi:DNA end-binding protein Ku